MAVRDVCDGVRCMDGSNDVLLIMTMDCDGSLQNYNHQSQKYRLVFSSLRSCAITYDKDKVKVKVKARRMAEWMAEWKAEWKAE